MASVLPVSIHRLSGMDAEARRRLLLRAPVLPEHVVPAVREIIQDVRDRGDAALFEYTERFDGVRLSRLEVTPEEYEDALRAVSPELLGAIQRALDNIRAFHATQLQTQPVVETAPGMRLWREWRPIERVGTYVPGGRAVYPSVAMMNIVPASLAGCREIIACAPPGRHGLLPPATLVAAQLAGVTRFFKVGGAQAVAAMAYGTESVPRTYKLFGAGSVYVTAAKVLVFGDVNIDMPAGPSEILVIADHTADPALVASDLLAQSEHGTDSASVLVTPSTELAEAVVREMARQLPELPLEERVREALHNNGRVIVTQSLGEAVEFANEYASEHVEVLTERPEELLPLITSAGSVFLGAYSPNAAGDYATGCNHVHPTGGNARTFGPLSVESFGRWVQVQQLTREGLANIADSVTTLASAEGLHGHARSVDMRFRE